MGAAVHRRATLDDATRLFEVRRRSILELASSGMSVADAKAWAKQLTPSGMKRKLRELEIWIAELDDVIAGWGAIRGDFLEGLYTAPEYAGQGVGAALLDRLEALMRGRGVDAVRAEASSSAKAFYLRRGYRATGPQTPVGAWPITKQLLTRNRPRESI
jgi:putative acetyltransferase